MLTLWGAFFYFQLLNQSLEFSRLNKEVTAYPPPRAKPERSRQAHEEIFFLLILQVGKLDLRSSLFDGFL
jgi:hypothetical protein